MYQTITIEVQMDEHENDERACECGNCRYCDAYLSSEYDYEGDDYVCTTCNGGGCTRCE